MLDFKSLSVEIVNADKIRRVINGFEELSRDVDAVVVFGSGLQNAIGRTGRRTLEAISRLRNKPYVFQAAEMLLNGLDMPVGLMNRVFLS